MPKLTLSKELLALNPELAGEEVSIKQAPAEDKKHLFSEAWKKYAPENAPSYFVDDKGSSEYKFALNRKFKADFGYIEQKLLVEIDGGGWMVVNGKAVGRHNKDADLLKGNLCAELGFRVIHFSPSLLKTDPVGCVESVIRALNYATN